MIRLATTVITMLAVLATTGPSLGQEAKEMPKEVRRHLQKLVGQWEIKGAVGEAEYEGDWKARWAPGKTCLYVTVSCNVAGEMFTATGVQGWDAVNEQITEVHFSNWGMGTLRLKRQSPQVLVGEWVGSFEGKSAKTKDTFEWLGPDEWKITSESVENFPDGFLHAKRIAKAQRKKPKQREQ